MKRTWALWLISFSGVLGCSWFQDDERTGASSAAAQGGDICDDGNDCTRDKLTGHGCTHTDVPAGRACNGTLGQCIGAGTCNGHGTCLVSEWCNDTNDCTQDACVFRTLEGYVCSHANTSPGSACSDSSACTASDHCNGAGVCVGVPIACDDGNVCTIDGCSPISGCTHANEPATTACDDGKLCTANDHCNGHGHCVSGGQTDCDDGNGCTADSCSPTLGCRHRPRGKHFACDDSNACTLNDRCDGLGHCLGGPALICSDDNPCTVDACDAAMGCSFTSAAPSVSCSDGNACSVGDHCDGFGACASGTPVVCDDSNPCTVESCDTASGACLIVNADPSTLCNDANGCTISDHCDGLGGCIGAIDLGIPCNDLDACTSSDSCNLQGGCSGLPVDPNDNNPCTSDACDPSTGVYHQPVAAGTSCSDGNASNGDEVCNATGTCTASTTSIPVLARVGGQDSNVLERRLGAGRHPVAVGPQGAAIAFLEPLMLDNTPSRLGVAAFSLAAEGRGVGRVADVLLDADPVIAALPNGSFALAYTAFGLDGDGLGIALVHVSPSALMLGSPQVVNQTVSYGQRAPDILWTGSELIVAWEDESPINGRRLCTRAFSAQLAPVGDQACEPVDGAWASGVSLSSVASQLAVVWRKDTPTGSSLVVKLGAGTVGVALVAGTPAELPALVSIDASHLLVVYADGAGVQKAVLVDTAMSVSAPLVLNQGSEERSSPSLVRTADGIYLAWREAAHPPWNANLDELYLQKVNADGSPAGLRHTLPADALHLLGDQSAPATAASPEGMGAAIFAAWEDLNPNVPGQSPHGDVLFSLLLTPIVQ